MEVSFGFLFLGQHELFREFFVDKLYLDDLVDNMLGFISEGVLFIE